MIYLTQFIFIKEGQEEVFHEFESFAIPLMEKYNGRILYRIRPQKEAFIDLENKKTPYEIHFLSFDSEGDLQDFFKDEDRKQLIHLKEASIQSTFLVKGKRVN